MGAEINSTAMQEVGIMRLFHWLEFNWEAAVGWRRQKRLLKSSSETPFFIRELLSFLRPLLVPCPLATSLPPPHQTPGIDSGLHLELHLCLRDDKPANKSQLISADFAPRLLHSHRAHTNRNFLTRPSSPEGEPPLKLHLSPTPPIYRCLFLSPHSSLSPPCSSPSPPPCCTRATLCHFNMKTSVWLQILWCFFFW